MHIESMSFCIYIHVLKLLTCNWSWRNPNFIFILIRNKAYMVESKYYHVWTLNQYHIIYTCLEVIDMLWQVLRFFYYILFILRCRHNVSMWAYVNFSKNIDNVFIKRNKNRTTKPRFNGFNRLTVHKPLKPFG